MKHILKYFVASLFLVSMISCDNEDQDILTIIPNGSGEITAPETGTSYILNPEEELTNPAFTLTWNAADYDIPTEIKYTVEFAQSGTNFESPFIAGSTTNLNLTWSVSEFNGAAVSAGLPPFTEGSLEVRILSTVGTNESTPQISEPISVLVTPFTTDLPTIAVPGNHQGWDPASAPLLASSGFGLTDYEGYVWLDGMFKFIAPNETGAFNWGNTDWGDAAGIDGSYTEELIEEEEGNSTAEAGYYFVKADTDELTYSVQSVNWGIIGAATPNGWDSDTDLIYDADSRTLSANIDLVGGAFKFRGNDEWGAFDLGTLDDDGFLQGGGDLTFDGSAGNYKVTLDLSNPRAYTYSLVKN